ncbi:hypothetical protein BpHYR1_027558 [Brachionus plicatilis]|uniref:Uncharacterized protein n=1 Tax=Brachionus plicatilis TaxID=10195 RepID=A0A3M7SND9_BRAPC|nr:hypothetical protein BpHYR1_027558 [Brachionus plicatilis]
MKIDFIIGLRKCFFNFFLFSKSTLHICLFLSNWIMGRRSSPFAITFLSNDSDLTQSSLHRVDHLHRFYYPVETGSPFL